MFRGAKYNSAALFFVQIFLTNLFDIMNRAVQNAFSELLSLIPSDLVEEK
jgi:hypothetical protein